MKTISLYLLLAASAQASTTLSYTQTTNNGSWPSAPSGYISGNGAYGYGSYDAFLIHASGNPNATISSITIGFHFSGLFDDSVGIDLNGDGAIDYAIYYYDMQSLGPGGDYQPWASYNDVSNLGIVLTINNSGASATSYLYGQVISLGASSVNNLASINLSSLGLASLDASGNATSTGSFRIGFLNSAGPGGGLPTLNTSSFNYSPSNTYYGEATVPEPSTYGLIGICALGVAFAARRKKLKKV